MVIYLDMDGVLADFDRAACEIHTVCYDAVHRHRGYGEWDLRWPIARARGWSARLTADEFWDPIHGAGAGFWRWMNETQWYGEILELVKSLDVEWYILTSPSHHPSSTYGKLLWIKDRLGPKFEGLIPTPHKSLFAHEGAVLIDDRDSNCHRFEEADGNAIVFPAWGNSRYTKRDNPIKYVESQLKRFF